MSYLNMQDEKLLPVVMDLNTLLSDYHMYYQKLRSFHWNILGKNFFDLHEQFEDMYNDAQIKIDEIAERILTLRHHPVSKFSDYIKIATVQEESAMISDQKMIETLLNDHKIILAQMSSVIDSAENAGDEGTIDLVGAYIRELEKTSWMLNAWTKKSTEQLKEEAVAS
ncbi:MULTISPECIES: Dps family protein [Mesoflavibacter]|uniref:DNA starvation/stationary phase protection protein n=1 Tax=Mesoflavibacter zeaxanthinifaciens subsp. sabulilitoris TaxID=1520893 RepID=A0A2T1NGK0_9FLAO|nr:MULTISPECIES: DNA starvation/stationary phase protection protein [Mesoflavibacter]MBB3122940.1 starvation-inducible DNA-binding protein [Mesoflavibacter zeaxanthinifaciens subsp. sabulilitoris]PSG91986.1 DNA starvation/stationary phase protection protein [Mesoflavibacter zeaxanthinifaciens subsp. sabulilitoris]UAB75165.1 DNA starvation/stationary phase protection protein [Mesoflavibacter sp. SCSIO 43206]